MKAFVTILLLCLSLSAYGDNPERIIGQWTEYWYPTGDDSDVTYSNTMKIFVDNRGNLAIDCVDDDIYVFDNITYQDNILTFRKENKSAMDEDGTRFYIYYTLVLLEDGKIMKGGIVNSVQQTNPMKWTKINSESGEYVKSVL